MSTSQRQRRTLVVIAVAVLILGLLGACNVWMARDDNGNTRPGALQVVPNPSTSTSSPTSSTATSDDSDSDDDGPTTPATTTVTVPTPTGTPTTAGGKGKDAHRSTDRAPFAAIGRIDGLVPGQLRTLEVKVTNPDTVAYRILRLTATPEDASTGCAAATNLVVSAYDAQRAGARTYVVPRKSAITIPLTIMLLDTATNQDACKHVTFPLTFSGTATPGSAAS